MTENNEINEIILKISFPKEIRGTKTNIDDELEIKQPDNLKNAFKQYKKKKKIRNFTNEEIPNYFYLNKNNKVIQLNENAPISSLKLKSGDKIIISNAFPINQDFIYNIKMPLNKKNYIWFIIFLIILLIILIIVLIFIFVVDKKKKLNLGESNLVEEKLVAKINYTPNSVFRYNSGKNISMSVKSKNENENFDKYIMQYIDFLFIIRNENLEIDEMRQTKKLISGYLSILNLTINNGTDDITLIYDKQFYKYLNELDKRRKKNMSKEENYDLNMTEENNNCFIKIEFYENGEIKNIFTPQNFTLYNMIFFDDIIKLIIPKLSKNLYIDDFNERYEILSNLTNDDEEEDEIDQDNYEEEIENNSEDLRNLTEGNFTDENFNDGNFTDENITNENINDFNLTNEMESENFLSSPLFESDKINIRGVNYLNNSNNDTNKISNLTQFSLEELSNDEARLDNSELKTVIYSTIDEEGKLISIREIQNLIMKQSEIMSGEDREDDLNNLLNSEIYNENNMISNDYNESEDFIGKDFSLNLSNISMENINNIVLYDCFSNDHFNGLIYKYFDNFIYTIYNTSNSNDSNLRILQIKESFIKENNLNNNDIDVGLTKENSKLIKKKTKLRNLDEIKYYGLKNFETKKEIYKYNILGLKMEGIIISEIQIASGIVKNYCRIIFGFINIKFKLSDLQTNLHIIIDKTNKMIYNLISLLYQSNLDLIERNKNYGNIRVEIEKNTSNLFKEDFDYSGLFRESLDDLYEQVKDFSGEFFKELIILINRVYENFTEILESAKNDNYDTLNQIRIVTKNEYIDYIKRMSEIISNFENKTLLFLDNIYDIVDAIYDGKQLFKNFIKNLFKAVEKGIITFKYDIKDYIEEIIGELLYLTDFLSININKNEILKRAIEEQERNITTKKLKDFRNIIISIMDLLIANINEDYNKEMSLKNENNIKYNTEIMINNFIEEIDEKSNALIEQIKLKIEYINLYEKYSNNIGIINNISDKSFYEFNNDICQNILVNISNIYPEYINNNSDLMANKEILFNTSKYLTATINQEISEINKYIESYSKQYYIENLYNFHYNLYNIRKYFFMMN